MPTSDASVRAPTRVQSIGTALALLELLVEHDGANLSTLARAAHLTLNQTFRFLGTLEAAGYVTKTSAKAYRLGAKLLFLGHAAAQQDELLRASRPYLDALARESGESVLLAVRVGSERVIVDSREGRFPMRVSVPAGSSLPLNVGGLGLCLLAFAPPELRAAVLVGPLLALTPHTLTEPQALAAAIERVRESGVSLTRDTHEIGRFSVASAILEPSGNARAAVSISGLTTRLDAVTEARYRDAVRRAALSIGAHLG